MQTNDTTFLQRFREDIPIGRKMTIIHNVVESYFKPGDVLHVRRYEDDGYFRTIAVTATSTVTLDTLTEQHTQQENMTLEQLRQVARETYPAENRFYVTEFKRL